MEQEGAAGAGPQARPRKSALKQKKRVSAKTAERKRWEEEQKVLLREQVHARLARERQVLSVCEMLYAPGCVDIEQLEEASNWISRDDYADIATERSLGGQCGYPLCDRKTSGGSDVAEPSRVRLLIYQHREEKKGRPAKGRKFFCSDGCHRASSIFSANLLEYRPLRDLSQDSSSPATAHTSPHGTISASAPPIPTPTGPGRLPPAAARAAAVNAAAAGAAASGALRGLGHASAGDIDAKARGTCRSSASVAGGTSREAAAPAGHASQVLVDGIWRNAAGSPSGSSGIVEKEPLPPSTYFAADKANHVEGHRMGSRVSEW
jgi:hypothetical protein